MFEWLIRKLIPQYPQLMSLDEFKALVEYHKKKYKDDNAKLLMLLNEIYSVLYTEAYYDPTNEQLQKFAKPLADKMKEINDMVCFKD